MKIAVRRDVHSALPLMERVLRAGGELALEYPLVFHEAGRGRVIVAEEGGEVWSSCAVLERELLAGEVVLRAGLIGSVATAAERRCEGLASAVLERAEEELRARGCLISLLWADSSEYYEARGYRPLGAERDFLLSPELVASLPSSSAVRAACPDDYDEMHELYTGHTQRVLRSPEESCVLFQAPGMEVLVRAVADEVLAYTCRGRGQDLAQVVHEWGGETRSVLACLRASLEHAWRTAPGTDQFLMCPQGRSGVSRRLEELGARSAVGILGMGKLLDVAGAAALLVGAADTALDWEMDGDGIRICGAADRAAQLTGTDLLGVLLPACARREPLRLLEQRLATRFNGLPFEPFVWGLDSI